jgi:hypothetical protein
MGWDQTHWDGNKAFPTKVCFFWCNFTSYSKCSSILCRFQEDFDRDPELKDRLISLSRVDGHAKWVSSAVLRLMGDIPAEVEGGKVVRDTNGQPTGNHHLMPQKNT